MRYIVKVQPSPSVFTNEPFLYPYKSYKSRHNRSLESQTFCLPFAFLNSVGEQPRCAFTNLPKKERLGKSR